MKRLFSPTLLAATVLAPLLCPPLGAQPKKPFHFAHRGGAFEFEENTLFAFRSSYDKGLRGFETDIRMTKDGQLVVLHDDSLDRTHNGTGPVEALDAEAAKVITTKKQAEPLLFLDTLLDYLADKPGLYVEFEMKTSNKELYPDERIEAYAKQIYKQVMERRPEGSTWVFTSFDARPLKAIKKIDANAEIMFIKGGPLDDELMKAATEIGARRIACKMEGTTRLVVKDAQKKGFIVTGWPGRDLNDYFLGLGLGVDAICTDVPVKVQEFIESRAK
ncbi:glycerophosphodiester phosphodiesterase [Luteolibacter flavescens]|uniref:Glycerophosphodiester phosphodiesterase n=1 Tax=Luteolibacter flavescens TaxID=1859460 RepID=A0ABT3FKU5_9BACT|nr:glycerophosphodiester phosphodiesterase [Luteolibacter flavescens]MCW1884180.1 glycerophosphodiester phosphodiesterase [Luteolibacter flavescens]